MKKRRTRRTRGNAGERAFSGDARPASLAEARMRAALRAQSPHPEATGRENLGGRQNKEGTIDDGVDAVAAAVRREFERAVDLKDVVMTREQVAEFFKFDIKTITAHVKKHGLPARKIGREYRFLLSEVLNWVKKLPSSTVKP